ncbi:MAG: hypothetical protein VKO65_03450 [Cyanobacteriota bacterium]|nr:hypothetical protein [Cyanobacteriota bacterium]
MGIYEALQIFTEMKPVVVNPDLSYSQLIEELVSGEDPEDSGLIRQQLIAKLRRNRRHLSENQEVLFQQLTGEELDAFISRLQALPIAEACRWLGTIEWLGPLLDAQWEGPRRPQVISEHEDQLRPIEHGYGQGQRPEDDLDNVLQRFQREVWAA